MVESESGLTANFLDEHFVHAGAQIADLETVLRSADILIKVNPPTNEEIERLKDRATTISFLWPARSGGILSRLNQKQISGLAMDCVPRISRAQKLDALSSMANIAGYRAVIEAAHHFGSFFTGQITAAGKVPPAKVLVIGAGVAGLSAIGAARSLGAIVRAFDTRLAVKEQIHSMGAEFLELEFDESGEGEGGYAKMMSDEFIAAEMALFAQQTKEVDIVITTALIPGKPAPKLITADMVRSMRSGSVIVDLAAEQGGNCELTQPNETVLVNGVTIIGATDLPSRLPTQSSRLYANNVANLIADMTPKRDGQLRIDLGDQVVRSSTVTMEGETIWPPPKVSDPSPPPRIASTAHFSTKKDTAHGPDFWGNPWSSIPLVALVVIGLIGLLGLYAPPEFVSRFTVFVLAIFIGWQVIWNVTPALHTPLMSVTNAISGIIVLGGMLQMTDQWFSVSTMLATVAVLIATINLSGGFLVTQRMLAMFHKQN